MKRMTFKDLYDEEKKKPTAAQTFIAKVAELTGKSEDTVRQWIRGRQTPDFANRKIIADRFGVDVNTLFPAVVEA